MHSRYSPSEKIDVIHHEKKSIPECCPLYGHVRHCCISGCCELVANHSDCDCKLCIIHKCSTEHCNSSCMFGKSRYCSECEIKPVMHHISFLDKTRRTTETYKILPKDAVALSKYQSTFIETHTGDTINPNYTYYDKHTPKICVKCGRLFKSHVITELQCSYCRL